MHSVQSYLEKMSSPELKGILWSASLQPHLLPEECLSMILEILRSRNSLDPETSALAEQCLERQKEARQESQPERKGDNVIDLESFYKK